MRKEERRSGVSVILGVNVIECFSICDALWKCRNMFPAFASKILNIDLNAS